MIGQNFAQKPVESYYMNALPFSARKVGVLFFREYRLDVLVKMRVSRIDKELDARFKLAPEIWQLTLDHVILTKLSTFTLHSQLSTAHLVRLHKIVGIALGEPKANVTQLIKKAEENAPILADWLKQLKTALARKKA